MAEDWPGTPAAATPTEAAPSAWPGKPATPEAAPAKKFDIPIAVDPYSGLSPADAPSPEMADRIGRGLARGFLGGGAHLLGALDQPAEFMERGFQGTDKRRAARKEMVDKISNLVEPAPPPKDLKEKVTDIAMDVAGSTPAGIAQWVGGVPIAIMSGFETADEIASAKGKDPTSWETWRDAGVEGLARAVLGKAAAMPWGRLTSGLVFGATSGGESIIEEKGSESAGISALTNFVLGVLGKNITPGVKGRIEAAEAAAAAGNGEGAMRHLDAAVKDPQVAQAIAEAARQRGVLYPDPSGDATHQAAEYAFRDPRLYGPQVGEGGGRRPEYPEPAGPQVGGPGERTSLPRQEEVIEEAEWGHAVPPEALAAPEARRALPSPEGGPERSRGKIDRNAWKTEKLQRLGKSEAGFLERDDIFVVPSTGELVRITRNGNRARLKLGGMETVDDIRAARGAGAQQPMGKNDLSERLPPPGLPSPDQFGAPMDRMEKLGELDWRRGGVQRQEGGGPPGRPEGGGEWPGEPQGQIGTERRARIGEQPAEAEWREAEPQGRIAGPPDPSGKPTFDSDGRRDRMPYGRQTVSDLLLGEGPNREARERAKATISTVITQRDRANALARQHWDTGELLFKGVPDVERIDMISRFMHGEKDAIPKPWREWFEKSADVQENQRFAETLGAELDYEYREHYWPLQWKQEADAAKVASVSRGAGPFFTKHKVFDDPHEGMQYGLELKTTNPAVLGLARHEAGNMAIARIMAMKDLVQDGLAVPEKELNLEAGSTKKMPADVAQWETLDVGGVRYRAHPEAVKMLKNSLLQGQKAISERMFDPQGMVARTGKGLWNAWMTARNVTIPLKLSLSAFHALHVLDIDAVQPYAAVFHQALNQRLSPEQFLKGIRDHKALDAYAYGKQTAKNWPKPFDELSPQEQVEQNLMIAGGYTPAMPSIYEIGAERNLRRTLNDVLPSIRQKLDADGAGILARAWKTTPQHARAGMLLLGKAIETMQHPMFADWIPSIKTAAYLNQAKLLVTSRPELVSGMPGAADALRLELSKVRRSIDNRFGEMQYDKEFMNPIVRKATMGSMLSVGWNWGFLREFGGGLLVDLPRTGYRAARNAIMDEGKQNEISTRTLYASAYVAQSLMLGGIMTYMMTGERPKDMKDMIYPKLPDGTRLNTMFFTREFGALYYHMLNEGTVGGLVSMAGNKFAPAFQGLIETWQNHDYFGNQVYDPEANPFTQVAQAMTNFGKTAFLPISLAGVASGQTKEPAQEALAFGGFSPAPKYVERSRTISDIIRSYSEQFPHITSYGEVGRIGDLRELRQLYAKWQKSAKDEDEQAYEKARTAYSDKYPQYLGKHGQAIKSSERQWAKPEGLAMFSRLPREIQKKIFDRASPGEKAWLRGGLHKEMRDEAADPTPQDIAGFGPKDQEAFLRTLRWQDRDPYLPFVEPSVRELFWSFQPPDQKKE